MFTTLRQSVQRLWDHFRQGPEVRRLKRRILSLEQKSRDFKARVETAHNAMKKSSTSRLRHVLSPDLVRDLLPVRARTISARATLLNSAAADAQFAAVAPAYREALASPRGQQNGLVATELQGLTWWVPIPAPLKGAARDRFIAKQRFPYRTITQTRELALGHVLIDIGANIGRMSIPRVILGDVEQAYCAEPDSLNYTALVRNVVDNGLRGLVMPDRVAVGAANGTARMRHAKYSGGHHLVAGPDTDGTIEVPCCRLDDWVERLSLGPELVAYVKVDTQGWEVQVLQGAPRLLAHRHIAWQLEVCPRMLDAAGTSAAELYELCTRHFTHFLDLGKLAQRPRGTPTRELAQDLAYLEHEPHTDIMLFNLE